MSNHRKISAFAIASLLSASLFTMLGRNYIRTDVMLDSIGLSKMTSVKYYDGLGRLEQTVAVEASPSGADLIQHNYRDRAGRIIRQYNAVPSLSYGEYILEQEVVVLAENAYGDANPYTLTEYEQSPLERDLAVTAPGQAWHSSGKSVRKTYLTNSESDNNLKCRLFLVNDTRICNDTVVNITSNGLYSKNSLFVTKTIDEDGHTNFVFTNKLGKIVLNRTLIGNSHADTYYIYDLAGNLTAVIPPALSASLGNGTFASSEINARNLGYFYIYDWEGRCRAKKLPGCCWQVTAYDSAGKAFMTQDGNMRSRGEALFSLADPFGRQCVTGIISRTLSVNDSNLDVNVLVECCDSTESLGGYIVKGNSFAFPDDNLLSVSYYDNYNFLIGKDFCNELSYRNLTGYDCRFEDVNNPDFSAKGMLTGSATRILGNDVMLYKSFFYDHHGNVIQTHEQNAMGGYDHFYYNLSFSGKPLTLRHEHCTADTTTVMVYNYTYDNAERLLTISISKDGAQPVLLTNNSYDEFGRLLMQSVGQGNNNVINYDYNVRGWTKGITNAHFKQTIHYEDGFNGSTPCYNGNVCAIEWEAKVDTSATKVNKQHYCFDYDGLDRLTLADFTDRSLNSGDDMSNQRNFSCSFNYDINSNVTSLNRKGVNSVATTNSTTVRSFGNIDNLILSYNGNQLKKVVDLEDQITYVGAMDFKDGADKEVEYTYDANGNMTCDRNKGIIGITYNLLNLPEVISFGDKHEIIYTYAADGRKLRAEYRINNFAVVDRDDEFGEMDDIGLPLSDVATFGLRDTMVAGGGIIDLPVVPPFTTLTTRDYCGNYIYRNGTLERILTPTGYIEGDTLYHYIKDYQGNVRCVVRHDGTLVESNEYYPYGGLFSAAASAQPYKYGSKELDRTNGLDLYDSEARWYDSLLGRTTTMDPLAEKYYSISPYAWCAGNPVKYVDPDGNDVAVLHYEGEHIALLISEDNKSWYYYSINGNNVYSLGSGTSCHSSQSSGDSSFSGGSKTNDVNVGPFESVSSFLDSDYNREQNGYNYDKAFVIKTTSKQAKIVADEFMRVSNTEYSLNPFSPNHCGTAVQKSLESIGIETRSTDYLSIHPMTNIYVPIRTNPYLPSSLFYNIVLQNNGSYVKQN